jgi:hypothetical protein
MAMKSKKKRKVSARMKQIEVLLERKNKKRRASKG